MAGIALDVALQEWAAVCAALATGEVILTVRKGGILDKGGFQPAHRRCMLWPSLEHQDPARLRSPWSGRPLSSAGPAAASHWAELSEVWWLDREAHLAALAPLTAFSDVELAARFAYRGKPGLHLLALRVYPLPVPVAFPPDVALGCRSWIPLPDHLVVEDLPPIVPDPAWRARLAQVHAVLEPAR